MNREQLIAWAAGIFEGEGSFQICKGKSKGISISSTDLDVLERLHYNFKGVIYKLTKRKSHWKDAWLWSIQGSDSIEFYNLIKPFLLKRRTERGDFWALNKPKEKNYDEIIDLFNKGLTHKKISEILGLERSSVSHFLNRRNLRRTKK